MGQYHGLYNLDKKEMIFPHEFGFGAKQREHAGYRGAMLPDILYALTAFSVARGGGDFPDDGGVFKGRWHGDRVAVVGDYAVHGDLPEAWDVAFAVCEDHLAFSQSYFRDISAEIKDAYRVCFGDDVVSDITSLSERFGTIPAQA
jgi:hypothetical protein